MFVAPAVVASLRSPESGRTSSSAVKKSRFRWPLVVVGPLLDPAFFIWLFRQFGVPEKKAEKIFVFRIHLTNFRI
jgi:hypothetical protein